MANLLLAAANFEPWIQYTKNLFAGIFFYYSFFAETIGEIMTFSNTTNTTEGPVTNQSDPVVNGVLQILENSCLLLVSILTFKMAA